jgi:hypothetical protein
MSGAGARCGAACQKLARVNAQGAGKIAGRGRAAGTGDAGQRTLPERIADESLGPWGGGRSDSRIL